MYQSNIDKRSLRSALLLGAASVAAIGFAGQAMAQDQSTETVVVTGSRIPQQGLYAPSPVTAVGQQEMKLEGTTGVETLLNNLPSVFASQTSGVSNASTGTATVNLRGLGSVRTLVLVNGTRLAPGDPAVPVADLNTIPAALVDHVEVLTGGASAVYGSDALAGVVNFVMRKDFEGIEVDAQYGISEADNTNGTDRAIVGSAGDQLAKENIWDGRTETGTIVLGTNTANGKGNVTAYLSYNSTEAVLAGARDFSACSFSTNSPSTAHVCGGSSTFSRIASLDISSFNNSAAAIFKANFIATHPAGTPVPPAPPGITTSYFMQGNGTPGAATVVPFNSKNTSMLYNFGATNYLQRPDTRYDGGFFAHYEVNKELDIYTSFMFTDDNTIAQIAARGLFFGVGSVSGASWQVNCTNPLLSASELNTLCTANPENEGFLAGKAGFTACTPVGTTGNCLLTPGEASVEIGRRSIESGPLTTDLRHTTYRAQVGARGDLGDGWNYDVYAQYSTSVFQSSVIGFFSTRNSAQALQAIANPAVGAPGHVNGVAVGAPVCISGPPCVPLDVFSGVNPGGAITPAMLAFVQAPALSQGYTEEQIVSGSMTGDLGQYGVQSPWAKSGVAVSFGSEYRAEYLALQPDEEDLSGDLNGAGGATLAQPRAGFSVVEGFAELKAPLIQEKPFAEDLSFNAGYRYSSYSTAGSVSAYKYGAEWQPIDDIRFRASYERAVRAPNVLELFAPNNVVLFSGQDPCSTTASVTPGSGFIANCAAVPNAGTNLLQCSSSQCNQQVGGNAQLRPEIGDTRTIGVVLTPTFLDGFTATIDYFNIDVSNAISTVPPSFTLSQCYSPGAIPLASNPFCAAVHRNANGQIFGNGFVSALNVNTGFIHTKGFDFEANYNWSMDDWSMTKGYGALQFQFIGTWMQSFEVEPVNGAPTFNCAGVFGPTCSGAGLLSGPGPKWRHRLRVTWATPWDLDLSANWRYIAGTTLEGVGPGSAFTPDNTINDFWYLDLSADWNVRPGLDLHAGVNNVFDRLPPTLSTFVIPVGPGNDNTFPGSYDALGRTLFIGASIKY